MRLSAGCQNKWCTDSGGIYRPKPICFCCVENYGLVLSPVMVKHRIDLYQMSLGSLWSMSPCLYILLCSHGVSWDHCKGPSRWNLCRPWEQILPCRIGCTVLTRKCWMFSCMWVISVDHRVVSSTGVKFSCCTCCLDKCSLLHVQVSWLHGVDVILLCRVEVDLIVLVGCWQFSSHRQLFQSVEWKTR